MVENTKLAIDYTKFNLKPKDEIVSALEDVNNIFVVSCNKCFKEFTEIESSQCSELMKILTEANKKITGCIEIDFLCSRYLTEKILVSSKEMEPHGHSPWCPAKMGDIPYHSAFGQVGLLGGVGTGIKECSAVLVNSCGIGVQTVADIVDKITYTAANSIPQGGYHDMSLSEEKCQACADCVLSYTGGICPIVNCTKGLLNGPCGGAKNGKCEIDPDKDCGWDKIIKRLQELNRLELTKQFTKTRDYSKPDFKKTNSYSILLREKRSKNFYGGVYPEQNKEITHDKKISPGPEPKIVILPLSQHTGAICEPLVKVGDNVRVGEKIADSKGFISAPVHSSISGRVLSIESRYHPLLKSKIESIIIESDGKGKQHESVKPCKDWPSRPTWQKLSREEIIDIIREKGIVGLGGAQFPTHVKLKSKKPIDSFILNGCECEPYLTADHRVMVEKPEDVVLGMKILMKALGVKNGYITVEDNKPESVEAIRKYVDNDIIKIVQLETKYPQGAERMLIKKVLDREVPPGGLPLDVGVVVNNVSTALSVSEAVVKGLPLIKRVITVTGERVKRPGNFEVKIGTPLKDVLDFCEVEIDGNTCIKTGGPMMGVIQEDLNVPVIKGVTGILVYSKPDIEIDLSRACIKCGRCVDVCPMELLPLYYGFYAEKEQWKETEKYGVLNCIECGCCDYVCPMKRSLVSAVKRAKMEIRGD